jgi:SnoaL-like domain
MSEENVEIVRRTYARWARGDMQAGVDLFDPEIVFESFTPDANERIVVTGPAKIAAFMEEFPGQWREYRSTCCSSPNRSRCIPETPDGSAHEAGTAAPEVMRRHPVETDKGAGTAEQAGFLAGVETAAPAEEEGPERWEDLVEMVETAE